MQTENPPQVSVWRMLAGCVVVFCAVSLWIVIAFPGRASDLWFYFTYMTVACTFLPLPTPQIVMDYGGRFGPLLAAIVGGIGSDISVTIDYALVAVIFRYEKVARIKTTRTYLYVERIFNKAAFVSLIIGSLTPIPFEPIKLLACVTRYNRLKYLLAVFIGRTSRYYLLGVLQKELLIPRKYLYGSVLAIVIIEVVRRLLKLARKKRSVTRNR
ncbi:YqaA family protein [Candidatus Poribacteria bacterium]